MATDTPRYTLLDKKMGHIASFETRIGVAAYLCICSPYERASFCVKDEPNYMMYSSSVFLEDELAWVERQIKSESFWEEDEDLIHDTLNWHITLMETLDKKFPPRGG